MSADKFYTPEWVVLSIFEHVVGEMQPRTILEPSAGKGVFVEAARAMWPSSLIYACDIDREIGPWPDATFSWTLDYLHSDTAWLDSREAPFDLIIGNPPFSLALEFVERSLDLGTVVVFVLRLTFLASVKRAGLFAAHPPAAVWVLPSRPSFTDDGKTDSADYGVFVWRRDYRGPTTLRWLPPKDAP